MTVRRLVYLELNPALKDWGYQPIETRIGIESGEGIAVAMGSRDTKRSIDLVGDFINMALEGIGACPARCYLPWLHL